MEKTNRKYTDSLIFGRLLKFSKPVKKNFIIAICLMIISVIINSAMPLFQGWILGFLGEDVINKGMIALLFIAQAVMLVGLAAMYYIQNIMLQKAGQRIIYNIREEVFFKIENYSNEQLNEVPIGKLVTRVTNDTQAINEMYTEVFVGVLKNICQVFFIFIFMLITSVKLTLITLIIAPIILAASLLFRKFSRQAYRGVRSNVASMNGFLSENISGIKITQGFAQEEKQLNGFIKENNNLKKSNIKEILSSSIFRPFIYIIYILTVTLVLYVGGKDFLSNGPIGYVIIFTFYMYIESFFQPIQQLAEKFNVLQSAMAASERIIDVLDSKPGIVDAEDAIELEELKGKIEFRHVWFAYEPGNWVLKDINFVINPGETVAFVGATGSGKSTILSLIVRNYDIQEGEILIDDIDIKKIKISSLRSKIGQMLQDVFLFNGSIKENISMFTDMTDDEIIDAAKFVNADKFVNKLPDKFDEIVKERGNNFSAGERQLLSFSRCIASKPQIMVLDEATANIDTETEVLIQDSLEKMMNIGTMLIVAHRLSTIQYADQILVMRKGKIIERGTHQELLNQGGHYYDLYKLQYRDTNE